MRARGVFSEWFRPRRFYRRGIPPAVHTALGLLPELAKRLRGEIRRIQPRRLLEIGPGAHPLAGDLPGALFVDIAHAFCRPLAGRAIEADARALPFRDASFDLVVAADLFTHIPGAERWEVLREIARTSPRILIFNPEPGTPEVHGSAVWTESLVGALEALAFTIERTRFTARRSDGGPFPMDLLVATRLGVEPTLPPLG